MKETCGVMGSCSARPATRSTRAQPAEAHRANGRGGRRPEAARCCWRLACRKKKAGCYIVWGVFSFFVVRAFWDWKPRVIWRLQRGRRQRRGGGEAGGGGSRTDNRAARRGARAAQKKKKRAGGEVCSRRPKTGVVSIQKKFESVGRKENEARARRGRGGRKPCLCTQEDGASAKRGRWRLGKALLSAPLLAGSRKQHIGKSARGGVYMRRKPYTPQA